MPAQATANSVMVSAKRLSELRQSRPSSNSSSVIRRIVPAREVSGARPGADLLQQHVMPAAATALCHDRAFVLQIAERDGLGGAGLLAGGDDLVAAQRPVLLGGRHMRRLDALR